MYINCYSLRLFADISKELQKGHNFWQIKDHNSGRRYENKSNEASFFNSFSRSNCLENSLLHFNIVKIHFHGVPPLVHSGLQNT